MYKYSNKQLIVGVCPYESGGRVLSHTLSKFPRTNIKYLASYKDNVFNSGKLPWHFNKTVAKRKLKCFRSMEGNRVGGVAPYYLNYLEFFVQNHKDVKLIFLWREKDKVINSLIRKNYIKKFNFNEENTRKSFEFYYDLFKSAFEAFKIYYPKKVISINVNHLFSDYGRNRLKQHLNC